MASRSKAAGIAAKPKRGTVSKRSAVKKKARALRARAAAKPAGARPRAKPAGTRPPAKPAGARPRAKAASAMFQKIAFTLFQVADAQRARAFYEDVLGLTRGLAAPNGVWTEYDLPGGGCLALFCHPMQSARTPGGASVAFEVADLDALNQRLRAAGVVYQGEMVHGPRCRMSNILDSEGNAIILHELAR
jgi:predicted enzyme related to lactoylglutathione lyase